MADTQDLLRLADEVAAATGPDRDLDRAIKEAVGHAWDYAADWGPRGNDRPVAFAYTASLDAAMSLIDGHGVLMHLSDIGADGLPLARVGVPGPDDAPIFTGIASCIMTKTAPVAGLAIALCAAALKARAHSTKETSNVG